MKNNLLFYVIIISVFSFDSLAQKERGNLIDKKSKTRGGLQVVYDSTRTVKSYHVEEKIKMNFGGYTTTYKVSDSTLVSTNDLGPNNTRVVTKQFVETKQLVDTPKDTITDSLKPSLKPSNLKSMDSLKKQSGYASVFMLKTYERVAEKGYKSVDIFQKLGNAFYFNNELDKAARWYGELFAITLDLEPEYYYRYSTSLKSIGKNDKANEMLAKFNQLSDNNNSK
jgi:tetratricopeptide (TPR) repeat protein